MTRFLTLLLLCLCCGAVRAAPEPLERIRAAAMDYVVTRVGEGAQVSAAPLDPRLAPPACDGALQASAAAPNPGNPWSVAVHCAAPSIWTLYVPVRAGAQRQAVVATRPLAAGMPLTADDLALRQMDIASLPNGYLPHLEDAVGKLLRRPVAMGAALSPAVLDLPASVKRGQEVVLLSQSGSFSVRASGKALSDGAGGQRIKAENLDTHRVVEGVVRGDGVLEVGI
jgi:flagella basal body P-ring formation protein FlgA